MCNSSKLFKTVFIALLERWPHNTAQANLKLSILLPTHLSKWRDCSPWPPRSEEPFLKVILGKMGSSSHLRGPTLKCCNQKALIFFFFKKSLILVHFFQNNKKLGNCFRNKNSGMVAHLVLALGRQRQVNLCELQAHLVYVVSPRATYSQLLPLQTNHKRLNSFKQDQLIQDSWVCGITLPYFR